MHVIFPDRTRVTQQDGGAREGIKGYPGLLED